MIDIDIDTVSLCDSGANHRRWLSVVFPVAVGCVSMQQDIPSNLATLIGQFHLFVSHHVHQFTS